MPRNLSWSPHSGSTTIAHTNAAVIHNLTNDHETKLGRTLANYTVERVVGSIQISAPAGSTAYDSAHVYLGLAVVENDSIGAGILPEPFADEIPWLWTWGVQLFVPDNPSASLATLCIPDHAASPYLDIRQQRRVAGFNHSLVLVGYDDSGITGALNVSFQARSLFRIRV